MATGIKSAANAAPRRHQDGFAPLPTCRDADATITAEHASGSPWGSLAAQM